MRIAELLIIWIVVSIPMAMIFGRMAQSHRRLRGSHPEQFLNTHRFWRYT